MIGEELLTLFYLNLLAADLADVVFSLLSLQFFLLFFKELASILHLTLFVLDLDLD